MAGTGQKDAGKGKLTQDELYREMLEYLEINNICTLAFAHNNVPRATPVEYRNDGATLYVVSEGRSYEFYQKGEKGKVVEWKKMFIETHAAAWALSRHTSATSQPAGADLGKRAGLS